MTRVTVDAFDSEFRRYRRLAERAAEQLSWDQVRFALDPEVNSIAVMMKHLGGNLRSRWTDPLTTDGEKPDRNRDGEFIDDFRDREAMLAAWNAGWETLEGVLQSITDADLGRTLKIRGQPHTLALALARSLSHTAYHAGQIVQTAKVLASRAGTPWQTLTIPQGGSAEYNKGMGYTPTQPGA
ncbi:MAG: DUF1572 family protein [Phycisphaeraceae bacterium]|nr:DUF1572 family protein [Phycisphaeraceae bacterium]